MTGQQSIVLAILAVTIGMFLWGRWRHDIVALAALLATVAAGLVPSRDAFAGFGHPAVITVACVLVLSSALQATGAIDALARVLLPRQAGVATTIGALSALAAMLSGFMNNVGALALLMPLAIQTATRLDVQPGKVLMPVAFGSILGGMTTLIGTPPNLIVSGFRGQNGAGAFAMFDFTPVGLAVALGGLAFIMLLGRRLIPTRERRSSTGFDAGAYLTEARVNDGSKAAGMTLREIETELGDLEAQVIGLVRNERRIAAPNPYREVKAGDILVIEAEPDALSTALSGLGLQLEAEASRTAKAAAVNDAEAAAETAKQAAPAPKTAASTTAPAAPPQQSPIQSDDVRLVELAVRPRAELVGRSVTDISLRSHYGINLLAMSRQGSRTFTRLKSTSIRAGDVLLVQGTPDSINDFASRYGCIPLAERALRIPEPRKALIASAVMAASVACAALGAVPAGVAFAAGVLAMVLSGVVPPRRLYDAIDWPVIVLLAALMPVAGTLESSGTADLIARGLMRTVAGGNAVAALVVILVVTMFLSDFMNNAATAAVMCPVAIGIAKQLGANADAFLMAVAVGASCAFLTPIGHQNNTLILGPGGFRFGDYWQLGLPLEIVITLIAVPMLLWTWPL